MGILDFLGFNVKRTCVMCHCTSPEKYPDGAVWLSRGKAICGPCCRKLDISYDTICRLNARYDKENDNPAPDLEDWFKAVLFFDIMDGTLF